MSTPGSPVVVTGTIAHRVPDPLQILRLERQQQVVDTLCDALHDFLSFGLEDALAIARMKPPKPPRPTMEDLVQAQEQLELARAQIAGIEALYDQMPEALGEMVRATQMPGFQKYFNELEAKVSAIQKAIEEPEDPSSPWDGSHRIGTLCAQCARNFEGVEPSVPALKIALKAAGWGRDADGDHICPACVASVPSTGPSDPAAAVAETSTAANASRQNTEDACQ